MNNIENQENRKLINAWKKASKDLNIEIETPFFLQTDKGLIKYDLLVKSFGSEKGTLIITTDDMSEFHTAEKYDFYCSALSPHYNKYDKVLYIDTLNDWGYFGLLENKPNWYTGEVWGENT